jgi:thiol-disulfide isomerase/thioredoxin
MRIITLFFFFCLLATQVLGQGIDFFHGSFDEALEKAKEEGKVIFVDAYTTWCGPCKRMAKKTFPDPVVGEFFNENFVNMKIDMEKGEGKMFKAKYPVQAFPTLYFIGADGEVVHRQKGAQDAVNFLKIGKHVFSKVDFSRDYAKAYEDGDRDPQLIFDYVQALNKSNKSSSKVANEYIRSQDDLTTNFNLNFILEATTEADSRIFDLLVEHKSAIVALNSKEVVNDKILAACEATVKKAVEFEAESLLDEAKAKAKSNIPKKFQGFALESDLYFHKAQGNSEAYRKCCKEYAKKQIGDDTAALHELALSLSESFDYDANAMKDAEKFAKKAADNSNDVDYMITYASILNKNGKTNLALKSAQAALEHVTDQSDKAKVQKLLHKLKS